MAVHAYGGTVIKRRTDANLSTGEGLVAITNGDNDTDIGGANPSLAIGVFTADVVDATALSSAVGWVSVQVDGVARVRIGDTVTAGNQLTAEAGGRLVPATAGQYVIAKALESGVDGDFIPAVISLGAAAV